MISDPNSESLLPVSTIEKEKAEWIRDFEAASRRSLKERLAYALIHTHKPGMDDEPFRSFETLKDYRRWCEEKLPSWLGYGKTL